MAGERERVIAGRYRLRQRLGSGGSGSVWLAEDEELRAQVAVKEIDVPHESEGVIDDPVSRGRKEALRAAQLREHPNVITVYDVVEAEDRPWIVMEYLPGTRDLHAVVRKHGPLSSDEVARIGAAALDGLSAGHRLGIIHRDVKPANLLLAPDHSGAADRRVLLTDYGISLRPRETRITQSGMVVGTPGYVAPERLSGGEATPASDLFSLGVTLYFAVEGTAPFERDTLDATLMAALATDPSAPQRASAPLSRVIMGLLAKDPLDRTQAAEAGELLAEATQAESPAVGAGPAESPATATDPRHPTPFEGHPLTPTGPTSQDTRKAPGRRTPVLLALVAMLVGGGGFALGAATFRETGDGAAGLETRAKAVATPSPKVTRSTYPYGRQTGLREGLAPGQCVDADWKDGQYEGRPGLKLIDCYDDDPEGQVIATVAAGGAVQSECTRRTAELRKTMADPVLYVLTPEPGQSEPPAAACLLFLRHATLGGPLGDFRKFGDEVYISQLGPGDCINTEKDKDGTYTKTLVSCEKPHDEQMVGWARASGDGSAGSVDMAGLCEEKYGVNWARGQGHEMSGWYSTDEEWDDGFRYALCSVERENGKQLPGGVLKPAY
ncbi:serine/threonine-protein kinase [Streptomyces sp. NBC_00078]|uniref:serine/threonine-protein kinase n=1 Tax=unclassified Streptomyces TaxID=2593676 RepID=UPI00225A9356|nr:serine/threonine-protein kinase [Streptomyces sp. NBC_00078]MCX5424357.1 serine/threonine protein kinase [Streptomyces sp. NBC_00078]